jgi:hypothetical protein
MNFFKFLNSRNVQLTIEIAQTASKDGNDFSVYKKSEIDAAQFLADAQCFIYKYLVAVPKLLAHFLLVKIHLVEQKTSQELAEANRSLIQAAMDAKLLAAKAAIVASKPASITQVQKDDQA